MSGYTTQNLQSLAAIDAQQWGIPVSLFQAQIAQESGFNPSAVNGNATGIAQFEPGTASMFGIDSTNPVQSLSAAAQYDSRLHQQTGSWVSALQAYGTLPAAGSPLSTGQQAVASLASSLDNGGFLGGGALSSLMGGNTTPLTANGTPSGILGTLEGFLGIGGSSSTVSLATWLEDVAARAILVFLGLTLIIGGIYLLGQRSAPPAVTK